MGYKRHALIETWPTDQKNKPCHVRYCCLSLRFSFVFFAICHSVTIVDFWRGPQISQYSSVQQFDPTQICYCSYCGTAIALKEQKRNFSLFFFFFFPFSFCANKTNALFTILVSSVSEVWRYILSYFRICHQSPDWTHFSSLSNGSSPQIWMRFILYDFPFHRILPLTLKMENEKEKKHGPNHHRLINEKNKVLLLPLSLS